MKNTHRKSSNQILSRLCISLYLLLCVFFTDRVYANDQWTVAFILGDSRTISTAKAIKEFYKNYPQYKNKVTFKFVPEVKLSKYEKDYFDSVDILFMDIFTQNKDKKINNQHKVNLIKNVLGKSGKVYAVGDNPSPGVIPLYSDIGVIYDSIVLNYWANASGANEYNMLLYVLAKELQLPDLAPNPVIPNLDFGFYHDADDADSSEKIFSSFKDYLFWYKSNSLYQQGRPWVGVSFYSRSIYDDQSGVLDTLVEELERKKINVLPFFGFPARNSIELLESNLGTHKIDLLMAFNFRFAGRSTQKALEKLNVPIMNMIQLYGRNAEEWSKGVNGLSPFGSVFQLSVPELSGLIVPMVVGSEERFFAEDVGSWIVKSTPIHDRIELAVARAERLLALSEKQNKDKKLAIFYYNYPPEKLSVGASYLNVGDSLISLLKMLKDDGYHVENIPSSNKSMMALIQEGGHNIPTTSPSELRAIIDTGNVELIPKELFQRWFGEYPKKFQSYVEDYWGEIEDGQPMFHSINEDLHLVIPTHHFGNIAILPQPARGYGEDLHKLYHNEDLPPPYNYAGVYSWVRHGFKADAIVHLGTHSTLEWMTGKVIALESHDPPEALLADLPNIYPFLVDDVAEALVAKRRSLAIVISHMVPPITKGGLYNEYAELFEIITDLEKAEIKSPLLAQETKALLKQRIVEVGLHKDLNLDVNNEHKFDHDIHKIKEYLGSLKNHNMPYGFHSFALAPSKEHRESTINAIIEVNGNTLNEDDKEMFLDLDNKILQSAELEKLSFLAAASGQYVPAGIGSDPIRSPDSLPTGKNIYGINPKKIPKKAAWEIGVKLADELISKHLQKHGKYPRKISYVIWGAETIRHEGVIESQIFHLLGTKPVWNARGDVVDVEVIPQNRLKRPRIDIVISSAAHGHFEALTRLIDRAIQKVNQLEELNNYVHENTGANAKKLVQNGYSKEEAQRRASVRIFDERLGTNNLRISEIVEKSGTWDNESVIADHYIKSMSYGYGNGFWGDESMEDVFKLTISDIEKVVHSSSSNLWGTLDNTEFYTYAGGLVQAVRSLGSNSPELVIADLKSGSEKKMKSINEEIALEYRARFTNPKWIEGMMKEGYAGANHITQYFEHIWGWEVTVPDSVRKQHWDEAYSVYVEDKYGLNMKAFFDEASPYARQQLVSRLLETTRKGYWKPSKEIEEKLASELISLVNENELSCVDLLCNNPMLIEKIINLSQEADVPAVEIEKFKSRIEDITNMSLEKSLQKRKDFISDVQMKNDQRQSLVSEKNAEPKEIAGYRMEKITNPMHNKIPSTESERSNLGIWILMLGLLTALILGTRNFRRTL